MGRTYKIAVCGSPGSGKTSLLESLLYGNNPVKPLATIEDTYDAFIQNERGSREKVRIYDTSGEQSVKNSDSLKHLVGALDAVVIVFDITDSESFVRAQSIKATIDKLGLLRDKKDSVVLVLGNKLDLVTGSVHQQSIGSGSLPHHFSVHQSASDYQANASATSQQLAMDDGLLNTSTLSHTRAVDGAVVHKWTAKEKEFPKDRTRFAEVSARDRTALTDVFCWMVNKLTQVPQKKFPNFPKTKASEDVHK